MVVDAKDGVVVAGEGDTYLLSVCMTNTGESQRCGEYWFLIPPANVTLDKQLPDHQVLLLVDKEEDERNSAVVVHVPTSHILLHEADLLSIQLLHDSNQSKGPNEFLGEVGSSPSLQGCWHGKPTGRVIYTQNVTFNKFPGQNIRGEVDGWVQCWQ